MKAGSIRLVIFFLVLALSFNYGVLVGVYKVFPYEQLIALKQFFQPPSQSGWRNNEHRIQIFEEFSTPASVVFVGDSIIEAGEWSDFFPSLRTANRGVGSDTSVDVLNRLDSIISVNPKIAFLMFGINDIYKGIPIEVTLENYSVIVSKLKDEEISVISFSTIQCQLSNCGKEKVAAINSLNTELESLSDDYDFPLIFLPKLSNKKGLDARYTYDGVHLTSLGYRNWVDEMRKVLQSDIEWE